MSLDSKECDKIRGQLYDYQQSTLDAESRSAVEHHLDICPSCRSELSETDEILSILGEIKAPEVSPSFCSNVMNLIDREEKKRSRLKYFLSNLFGRPLLKWAYAGSAAVLLIMISFIFLFKKPQQPYYQPRDFNLPPWSGRVKSPIIVEVPQDQQKKAVEQILTQVSLHKGKLNNRIETSSVELLIIQMDQAQEEAFFKELRQIGMAAIPEEGYRDKDHNIFIIIKVKKGERL